MKNNKEQFLYEVENMNFNLIHNLITKRKSKGLTQKDISDITGLTQQAVSRLETYGNSPSLTTVLKYLQALGLDINTIFTNSCLFCSNEPLPDKEICQDCQEAFESYDIF